MLDRIHTVKEIALKELEGVADQELLQAWRVKYLGRSAELGEILQGLKDLDSGQRPLVGREVNQAKAALEKAYESHEAELRIAALEQSLRYERLDVTLPGRPLPQGRLHPATQTLRRIYAIWAKMGFQVYRSREVETDEYNFELLNMPAHHPARDMWDTFHVTEPGILLRTHTSPGQIHVMRERAPEPIRVILPGMCYRYEQLTARSEIQFNQVEGLAVGRRITFADLKGTLTAFARRMFDRHVRTRFRAQHFPFTEPSAEMDIECFLCLGEGCGVCKYTGWLEILGCGMVHPTVLRNGGYDPEVFSGFAFGMGPERIAMLRYNIEDIRLFWGNDMRFLEQF
ncbi:MAG: phenylalanine--tRNA ligase subunit alpha [Chloroflexi bacterium RBG_16_48_8]|nr:MAG: phenylalanine--tRNA ligase subunit alpha [Chloroflexi bacterium RBG_16_48_8]